MYICDTKQNWPVDISYLWSDQAARWTIGWMKQWSRRNREAWLADRCGDWNDEVELDPVDSRDRVQKRREAVEEAGVTKNLVLEMVNPAKEERQERVVELEKKESYLDEEGLCLDEKCLEWSQNGKGCHGPQEELGLN